MARQITSSPGPRSRFARSPVGGFVPGDRDGTLLCDLYLNRAMSREQVRELHFGSVRRCNARLRQLFDHGYMARHYPKNAPYGAQAVYSIGKAAVPMVAARLGMEEHAVREWVRRSPTPTFIEHTLAIVDFYLNLRRAVEKERGAAIERWLPEMLCRHEYDLREACGRWRREVFKPDGFVRLASGTPAAYHDCFLEIDLGHTSSRQFAGKADGYAKYRETGLCLEVYGEGRFSVLVVTTGDLRLENLRQIAAEREAAPFLFTTFDRMGTDEALSPIWIDSAGARRRLME